MKYWDQQHQSVNYDRSKVIVTAVLRSGQMSLFSV